MATRSDYQLPEKLQGPADNPSKWVLKRIWKRVNRKNMHFMGCLVGREGSGKSYTAIRIASELDPTFTADRVIFDVVDLLELLADGEHNKGDFYVLDEAGVQFGVRTWQDRSQILANQALQIIRDENLGVIFTLPSRDELDSQADNRVQALYEITEKEHDEYVRGKWMWLDKDRRTREGKTYTHFPKRSETGRLIRYDSLAFKPPDADLIEPYKERKTDFQQDVYQNVIDEYRGDDEDDEDSLSLPKQLAIDIVQDEIVSQFITHKQNGEPYINNELIRAEYDISMSDSRATKALLERDLNLEEYTDG